MQPAIIFLKEVQPAIIFLKEAPSVDNAADAASREKILDRSSCRHEM